MTMIASSESAVDPLNPTLYSLLQRKFGEIKIANEGCNAHVQNYPDPFHPGRMITRADTWGEYYCVNCFAPETAVVTQHGDRPIGELVGRATLLVPNKRGLGNWREVEIKSFGVQPLFSLELRRGKTVKTIRVTPEHRWLLKARNGTKVLTPYQSAPVFTKDLQPGDRLISCYARKLSAYGRKAPKPSAIGVAQGFVFGDGDCGFDDCRPAGVTFHNIKDEALKPYFSFARRRKIVTHKGIFDRVVDLPRSWKSLPPHDESLSFLFGWLSGYFAADGHVTKSGKQAVLYSACRENLAFAKSILYRLGVRVSPIVTRKRTGFGVVGSLFSLSFSVRDLPLSFWLLAHHRARAKTHLQREENQSFRDWVVVSVTDYGECDEVFCAVVPGDEKFTLADNIGTMNCPFCKDTRHRLWINYLYGSEYDKNRRAYTHLANCYNEGCINKSGRREQLEDLIFGYGKPIMMRMPIKIGSADYTHRAVEPPGEIVPVDQLHDGHPAREYLVSRGFDPVELARDFQVGLVTKAANDRLRITQNRLYIPVAFNGRLVGWQARAVGDSTSGPKYFNGPGTSKSKMLYNYDRAASQPYLVVVEGVPSVWRLGAMAVALFGKTMSLWQQTTISTTWAGKPVFLMLDADARHEMDETVKALAKRAVRIIPVYLPDKRDPADYHRDEIVSLISMTGAAAGIAPF